MSLGGRVRMVDGRGVNARGEPQLELGVHAFVELFWNVSLHLLLLLGNESRSGSSCTRYVVAVHPSG